MRKEDELDLLELVKVIWSRKWFIVKVTTAFIILGLVIAFTTPKEYETSCTLIPEAMNTENKLGGSLGGLASLAGIDLSGMSSGSSTINPGLYRSVAQSTPFLLSLLDQKFFFGELQQELSVRAYYENHYQSSLISKIIGWPGAMLSWFKSSKIDSTITESPNNNIMALTGQEQSMIENLKQRILVTLEYDLNVVTVEVKMQDPTVAAQIADYTQAYITEYVTSYSNSKSKEQLKFIEKQYEERKKEFEQAQSNLAKFRDRNQNINTSQARSEEERLQSEYNLSFNIFNQLAQQRETIKLQVNSNTPVFTVLEPVKVPVSKSEPRRGMILLGSVFVGGVVSIIYILIKKVVI